MKNSHQNAQTWITVILGIIIFGLSFLVACQFLQPKGRVSCASFGSYEDAQRAFAGGAIWLDRDHDNKPCEERFPKESHGE